MPLLGIKSTIWVFSLAILLIGASIGSICVAENIGSNDTITLYGLFPTTGSMTSHGESGQAGFDLAISDLNTFLTQIGSKTRVKGEISEMGSDPDSALEAIKKLHESGVTMVIGQLSSAQVEAVKDYADENGILILASGTSAVSLAIPDDNILRFSPDDSKEALTTIESFKNDGINRIVPFGRNDVWGHGLVAEVNKNLSSGMVLDEGVWYEPNTNSYADSLSTLDEIVGKILETTDPNQVTIYAVTWDELGEILKEAAEKEYTNLEKVKWTGCDGNALIPDMLGSGDVAEYAFNRNFTALSVGPQINRVNSPVYQSLKKTLGYEPDGNAYGIYDSTKIAFEALNLNGNQDADTIRQEIIDISNHYSGEAGTSQKNSAGDPVEAHYILWGIKNNDGEYLEHAISEVSFWYNDGLIPVVRFYPVSE